MSMPDHKFPWIWTAWLLAIVASFAVIEGLAFAGHDTTLSRYIYEVSAAWPLFPAVLGAVFGGLAVHFWWHWSPPGSSNNG